MIFLLTKQEDGYLTSIWLDERKRVHKDDPRLDEDGFPARVGDPDPEWVREYRYSLEPPETGTAEVHEWPTDEDGHPIVDPDWQPETRQVTVAEYEQSIKDESVLLAREELAALEQPVEEGPDLSALARGEKV